MEHSSQKPARVDALLYVMAPVDDTVGTARNTESSLNRIEVNSIKAQVSHAIDFIHQVGPAGSPLRARLMDTSDALHYLKGFLAARQQIPVDEVWRLGALVQDVLTRYRNSGFVQFDEAYLPEERLLEYQH